MVGAPLLMVITLTSPMQPNRHTCKQQDDDGMKKYPSRKNRMQNAGIRTNLCQPREDDAGMRHCWSHRQLPDLVFFVCDNPHPNYFE